MSRPSFDRQLALQAAQRIVSSMIQSPMERVQYRNQSQVFYKFVRPRDVYDRQDVRFLVSQVRRMHELPSDERPRDYSELDAVFEQVMQHVEMIDAPFTLDEVRQWPTLYDKLEILERFDSSVSDMFVETSRRLDF